MGKEKKVLTTGQVARICRVAPRTVSKWFDSGALRGYRIPGSKDRRIPVEQLVRFMRAHGMPLDGIEIETATILIVDPDYAAAEALRRALEEQSYEAYIANSAFEAGLLANAREPAVILVDLGMTDIDPRSMVQAVRAAGNLPHTRLIGTASNLNPRTGEALMQAGFAGFLSKPFEVRQLLELIERAEANGI